MPYDRYLQSRTTNTAQVRPNIIRQAFLGGWPVSVAVIAAAMLAVLFPVGPSFYFQASRQELALVTSSPGAVLMLPPEAEKRRHAFDLIRTTLSARGELSLEDMKRIDRIASLFGIDKRERIKPLASQQVGDHPRTRAS